MFTVTRVVSQGKVWITFNVMVKDMRKHGFDNTQRDDSSSNVSSHLQS